MLIAAIGFAVICSQRNTRRRCVWIASSESRDCVAGRLVRDAGEHSHGDIDDQQFGRNERLNAEATLADHACCIVRTQMLEVDVHVAFYQVEVAAVPGRELVRHSPARGIESYDAYFRVLRNHEPVARRAFGPDNLEPAFEAIL